MSQSALVVLLLLCSASAVLAMDHPGKGATTKPILCYSKAVFDKPGCVFLGDIAADLKQHGPQVNGVKLDVLHPSGGHPLDKHTDLQQAFLDTFCHAGSCPIHYSESKTLTMRYDKPYWDIAGEKPDKGRKTCINWLQNDNDNSFQSVDLIYGSDGVSCPLKGTEYAFMRVGMAALVHFNILDVSDIAKLHCKPTHPDAPGGAIPATPAYWLSRGISYYESMYGKAFKARNHDYATIKKTATNLQEEWVDADAAELLCAVERSFCKTHKMKMDTTWKEVATWMLADCASTGLGEAAVGFFQHMMRSHVLKGIVPQISFDIVVHL